MNDVEVFRLLFRDLECIDLLPFERKRLMSKVRRRLTLLIKIACYRNGWNSNVKTKYGELLFDTYLHRFTKNLFDCLISCYKFRKGIFQFRDISNEVYHGTSTRFFSEIMKNGLLPSKAGQCWKEDKDKKPPKICLTDSMYAAEFYAINAAETVGGKPVVLVFNIRGIREKMKIKFEIFRNGPSIPFDIYKEMYFNKPIPPDRIRNWYFVPEKSAFTVLEFLRHIDRTLK